MCYEWVYMGCLSTFVALVVVLIIYFSSSLIHVPP